MIWVIVGYMWLFLHRPFEVWTWMGVLRIERVYMICTLIAWVTLSQKQVTENAVNFAIALFAVAMIVSTVMSPYTNVFDCVMFQNWMKLVVFYILVITSVKNEKDLKILVTGLIVCFFLYMLHSYREYLCGRFTWAMGTARMVGVDSTMADPNAFGASITALLPMLLPLLVLAKKRWHYLFMLAYVVLSLRCVQLTGSRTALVVCTILLVSTAVISKYRLALIPVFIVTAAVVWGTMSENLRDRYRTLFDSSINESATQSAMGRVNGFYDSMTNWGNSPIWGVGPDCHGMAIGHGFLSHILYGQIPSELGLIGVVAFLFLLGCYAANHIQCYNAYKTLERKGLGNEGLYCYRVSLGIVCSVMLLLLFGFGGHNGYRYSWVWYAAFQAVALSVLNDKIKALTVSQHDGMLTENGLQNHPVMPPRPVSSPFRPSRRTASFSKPEP